MTVVDELLTSLSDKFTRVSDNILSKSLSYTVLCSLSSRLTLAVDDMSKRLDKLEASIQQTEEPAKPT